MTVIVTMRSGELFSCRERDASKVAQTIFFHRLQETSELMALELNQRKQDGLTHCFAYIDASAVESVVEDGY